MNDIDEILKEFLKDVVHPEYRSGNYPVKEEQEALDRARGKFEEMILEKYNPKISKTCIFPGDLTSTPSGVPPSGEGVKVDINRVP